MSQNRKRKSGPRFESFVTVVTIFLIVAYACIRIFGSSSEEESSEVKRSKFEPVVYLSPSNQHENVYAAGNMTEASVMHIIAISAEDYLKKNGIEVITAGANDSVKDKLEYANEKNVTAYVAISSNDGSEIKNGEGTLGFYNSGISGSKELSEYVYGKVANVTPAPDRGLTDASKGESYLYEVAQSSVPSCMIEVEFHNTTAGAQWIIDHADELGKAAAEGIIQYIEKERADFGQMDGELNGE